MTKIPNDAVYETWESAYDKSMALANLIKQHCVQSGERFDYMVVIPRGGYYPANIAARELGFGATDLIQAAVGSYEGSEQGNFSIGQMPTRNQISGKNLIIIDEVCDTGRTLNYLVEYLNHIQANLIRSGVLHYKPEHSHNVFKPDWAVEITNQWIVYPWEEHDENGSRANVRR